MFAFRCIYVTLLDIHDVLTLHNAYRFISVFDFRIKRWKFDLCSHLHRSSVRSWIYFDKMRRLVWLSYLFEASYHLEKFSNFKKKTTKSREFNFWRCHELSNGSLDLRYTCRSPKWSLYVTVVHMLATSPIPQWNNHRRYLRVSLFTETLSSTNKFFSTMAFDFNVVVGNVETAESEKVSPT